uniref:SAM domain, SH3 domain and nuclear localisation signals 1b n=1 Tax=Xiphophorus couchianus TaxID=32473 RepID=A0A3B5M4Y8_9TELE
MELIDLLCSGCFFFWLLFFLAPDGRSSYMVGGAWRLQELNHTHYKAEQIRSKIKMQLLLFLLHRAETCRTMRQRRGRPATEERVLKDADGPGTPWKASTYPMSHRQSLLTFLSAAQATMCVVTLILCASGGVTSGSNCSSNRESLRLEDDLTFTRQFCCRARVHMEFVPSPYDTESLTLKVGDVIDVIAKPPMGTWTGSLNGRTGNFKFIYVDVLTHTSSTALHEVSQKSTVHEALRRLREYASSLQRGGYQTVDDLMELNVTQPERRERLLTAVNSLQLLHCKHQTADSLAEDESSPEPERSSEDMKSRPRDSGCVMTEDTASFSL